MASKITYNNIQYDILNAIPMGPRDYLVLLNPGNLSDIRYIEKANINGEERYFLPPADFSLHNNGANLKRLEINIIINKIINILKDEVTKGTLKNEVDLNKKTSDIKSFCLTDLTLKSFVEDTINLNMETFDKITTYLTKYLEHHLVTKKSQSLSESNSKAINSGGLDYELLYTLSSQELEELLTRKNLTSDELIYILDAMKKRKETDQLIENYDQKTKVKSHKEQKNAAFVDMILLSFITGSFGILLLLSMFN